MKRLYCILTLVAVFMLAGSLPSAQAQVPARISYQGMVLAEAGATLADGTYSVTFRLYTEESGIGQALWSETQNVPVQDGLLSTMIGAEQALNLPFDRPYYLTVQLEGQAESERMALSAAAYALVARDVPDSTVVRSISGLQDAVEIVAGDGISIQQRDNQLIISAVGPLKGYGPDEGGRVDPVDASVKTTLAAGYTEEEDEKAIEALLATLGGGGSNAGLDAAYDLGRVITLDDGRISLVGTGALGLELRDSDMIIRDGMGGNPNFRFRVDGASTLQVFKIELKAASGELHFINPTGAATPLTITKDATDKLLTLDDEILEIRDAAGDVVITLDADFGGDGRVITEELEITGGSDLSENFDITGNFGIATPAPGMVVSIDPTSPGRLAVSGTPYDRMVAGVVSGAGGIETGLIMGQRGSVADGAFPVALTGRVYVFVDAAYGAVSPGDLLTSSATAGHAMKVSDYGQAQGAIIGKAMTGLSEGQGLVLMLISLQ